MPDEAFKLEEATIADIHHAFRGRSLTCRQLVQRYIDRIEAYDRKGPALNSIVNVNQNALAEADRLDDSLSRTGTFVGPLHGIPVVVKDQAETKGIVTTFGSIALDGYIPRKTRPLSPSSRRSERLSWPNPRCRTLPLPGSAFRRRAAKPKIRTRWTVTLAVRAAAPAPPWRQTWQRWELARTPAAQSVRPPASTIWLAFVSPQA